MALWVMPVNVAYSIFSLLYAIEGDSMCTKIQRFKKDREIRSDSCKQPLPINPFGIVAYAFTDNLSTNSCIFLEL